MNSQAGNLFRINAASEGVHNSQALQGFESTLSYYHHNLCLEGCLLLVQYAFIASDGLKLCLFQHKKTNTINVVNSEPFINHLMILIWKYSIHFYPYLSISHQSDAQTDEPNQNLSLVLVKWQTSKWQIKPKSGSAFALCLNVPSVHLLIWFSLYMFVCINVLFSSSMPLLWAKWVRNLGRWPFSKDFLAVLCYLMIFTFCCGFGYIFKSQTLSLWSVFNALTYADCVNVFYGVCACEYECRVRLCDDVCAVRVSLSSLFCLNLWSVLVAWKPSIKKLKICQLALDGPLIVVFT